MKFWERNPNYEENKSELWDEIRNFEIIQN